MASADAMRPGRRILGIFAVFFSVGWFRKARRATYKSRDARCGCARCGACAVVRGTGSASTELKPVGW